MCASARARVHVRACVCACASACACVRVCMRGRLQACVCMRATRFIMVWALRFLRAVGHAPRSLDSRANARVPLHAFTEPVCEMISGRGQCSVSAFVWFDLSSSVRAWGFGNRYACECVCVRVNASARACLCACACARVYARARKCVCVCVLAARRPVVQCNKSAAEGARVQPAFLACWGYYVQWGARRAISCGGRRSATSGVVDVARVPLQARAFSPPSLHAPSKGRGVRAGPAPREFPRARLVTAAPSHRLQG